jgi:replicative DNA helicase
VARLRVPPHSIEAEQSVLGGLLLDNLAWDRAADLLTDSDFYRYEHRLIFGAIGALVNASKPADVITVFEQLQSHGKAEDCGGLAYLNALAQSVPSAANMRRYAEIVRERAILRKLIAASDEIATAPSTRKAGRCRRSSTRPRARSSRSARKARASARASRAWTSWSCS